MSIYNLYVDEMRVSIKEISMTDIKLRWSQINSILSIYLSTYLRYLSIYGIYLSKWLTNQPTDHPTNERTNQPTNKQTNQATKQPNNGPTEQASKQATNQPTNLYV